MQTQKTTISKTFIWILASFWLLAKLISYKGWIINRMFPLAPISNVFQRVPHEIQVILYCISFLLLLMLLIKPKRHYLLILAIAEISSCLFDQNRWQPWEYQYILMALVCWFYYYSEQEAYFLSIATIAFIYLYSGLHKIHFTFVHYFWKNTILLKFFKLSDAAFYFPYWVKLGYAAALLEALGGLCLLFRIYVKQTAWFLITMHIFILLVIGPWGINYNAIVWGWNIAMILFLYFLCIKVHVVSFSYIKPFFPNCFITILIGVLPILSFFNKWDYYLSCCLYSAKPPTVTIKTKSPPAYFINKKLAFKLAKDSLYTIHIQSWAMKEMGIPPYPEKRVLKKVIDYGVKTFRFKPEEFIWKELNK